MIVLTVIIVILLLLPFVYPEFDSMFLVWGLVLLALIAVFFFLVWKTIDKEVKKKKESPDYVDIERAVPGCKIKFVVVFVIACIVAYVSSKFVWDIWNIKGLLGSAIPYALWAAILTAFCLIAVQI